MKFFSNLLRGAVDRKDTGAAPDDGVAVAADREDVRAEVEQDFWRSFERQIASAERRGDDEKPRGCVVTMNSMKRHGARSAH